MHTGVNTTAPGLWWHPQRGDSGSRVAVAAVVLAVHSAVRRRRLAKLDAGAGNAGAGAGAGSGVGVGAGIVAGAEAELAWTDTARGIASAENCGIIAHGGTQQRH